MDDPKDHIHSMNITNESNNKEWLKQKLKKICSSTKFCGICIEEAESFFPVDMEFSFAMHDSLISLQNIMNYVFNDDIEYITSSTSVCENCVEKLIQSYLFISNARYMSKIINGSIDGFLSKVKDLGLQLKEQEYSNCNVVIVLENDSEIFDCKGEMTASPTKVVNEDNNQSTKEMYIPSEISKAFDVMTLKPELDNSLLIEEVSVPKVEIQYNDSIENDPLEVDTETINNEKESSNFIIKEGKIAIRPISTNIRDEFLRLNTYKCSECTEIFVSYRAMHEHKKSKHRSIVYQCKLCNKSYNTQQYLTLHYKTHAKVRCKLCRVILPDEKLMEHLRNGHSRDVHPCRYCNLVYYNLDSLETHFKTSHLVNDNRLPNNCIMCMKDINVKEFKRHRCNFFCSECTIMPCVHYKYLISYREQILRHSTRVKCPDCDYITPRKECFIAHVNRQHILHHPFTCDDCKQQFYTKISLQVHITRYHQDIYVCEFCEQTLQNSGSLESHRKICKDVRRLHACDFCPASFHTSEEINKHLRLKHIEGMYPCNLCKRDFDTELKLKEHHISAHSGIQRKKRRLCIECTLCDIKFKTIKELLEHQKMHNPGTKYPCKVCQKDYKDLKKLYVHKQIHYTKRVKCERCRKYVTVSFYPQHLLRCSHKNKSNICEFCGKALRSQTSLKIHLKIHTARTNCKLCGKEVNSQNLEKHMEKLHSSKKPKTKIANKNLTCDLCNHVFQKFGDLETHNNRYHLKVKPYVCYICKKEFCGRVRLKEHISTHTNDNVCYCTVCGRKCANKVCLKMHLRIHTGKKPFSCDICGDKFRSSSIMKIHRLKKHHEKSFACPLCNAMFHLIRDMRYHFKKKHWKFKDRPFDHRAVEELDPKYYHYFIDRRFVMFDESE